MKQLSVPLQDKSELGGPRESPAPGEIIWAVRLLWLSLTISVVQYLVFLPTAVESLSSDLASRGSAIVGLAIPFGVYLLGAIFNVYIARRRNWARIAKLVFASISILLHVFLSAKLDGLGYLSVGVVHALNFAALYLLFASSGRLWFRDADPANS